MRPFVAPIAPLVAPKAHTVLLESNPYARDFNPDAGDVCRVVEAAQNFAPEIYCIAPYQRTEFDELLAGCLTGCRTVGMNGILFPGVIDTGLNRQSRIRLDREVPVTVDQHELEKSEQLCSELLGEQVKLPDPVIRAERSQIERARSVIGRLGLEPGKYWTACVGCNQWTAVRNWPLENWAKVLSHAVERYGQKFLLIGTPDESAATEQIRSLMGAHADATENLCGSPQPLATAVGLLHLSAGYIGRDTGPMHLAAALGKPVIAVFGGGTWPRFIPRAKVGAVATVVMPCSGCDWLCHLGESYCVKRVPVESIRDAFDAIQNKSIKGVRMEQLPMDPMLSARIIRESSMTSRDLRRRLAAAELQTCSSRDADQTAALAQLQSELGGCRQEIAAISAARDALAESAGRLQGELAAMHSELARRQLEFSRANAERESVLTQVRSELEAASRAGAELQRTKYAMAELSDRLLAANREIVLARASADRSTEQLALVTADRDHLEEQVRSERVKAQSARRDAEKIRKQAALERQSILDVLNDLVVEHAALKKSADQQTAEAIRDVTAQLNDVRNSISFRVMVAAGRPVVALQRKLRALVSGGKTN
jgi:ADP-heptose:LPS heptosyltransferase